MKVQSFWHLKQLIWFVGESFAVATPKILRKTTCMTTEHFWHRFQWCVSLCALLSTVFWHFHKIIYVVVYRLTKLVLMHLSVVNEDVVYLRDTWFVTLFISRFRCWKLTFFCSTVCFDLSQWKLVGGCCHHALLAVWNPVFSFVSLLHFWDVL